MLQDSSHYAESVYNRLPASKELDNSRLPLVAAILPDILTMPKRITQKKAKEATTGESAYNPPLNKTLVAIKRAQEIDP
jgi:hypothetical protein